MSKSQKAILTESLESLTESFKEIRHQLYLEFATTRCQLRSEAVAATEHAELVTRLLMHFRKKGKMPRNWRSLTIPELLGFATTLDNAESIGEMDLLPTLSREESRLIVRYANTPVPNGLRYHRGGPSLVHKAEARLQAEE